MSTAEATLPNGKKLDYLGAYGGGSPIGAFFTAGTSELTGENSDGSVCIK